MSEIIVRSNFSIHNLKAPICVGVVIIDLMVVFIISALINVFLLVPASNDRHIIDLKNTIPIFICAISFSIGIHYVIGFQTTLNYYLGFNTYHQTIEEE